MSGQPGGEGAPAAQRCGGRRRSIGPCDVARRRARLFAGACCILVLAAAQLAAHASHALTPPPAIDAVHVIAPELPETRRLGEVVAADGDLLAISAPTDGDDALDPGRVMIMRLSLNARGTLEVHPDRTLFSHAPTAGDHFGASLAAKRRCADAGGADLVAVGADRANAGAGEGGDMRGDMTSDMAGAVEVFERGVDGASWRLAARLSARTPEPAASFGAAIAFDQGGSARLVVGAPRHDAVGAFDAGRVHVFRRFTDSRDAGTGARWTEVATITPPAPRLSMWFGSAVAIEGDLLAIASPGDDVATAGSREPVHAAGAVYIYRRTAVAATGSERYRLERVLTAPSPEPAAWFGLSIDLDDGVLAVGAPRARDQASGLLPTGCVYLFDLALAEAMPKRIDPPSGVQTYGFGQSLALRDGVLVIGAPSTDLLKHSAPDGTLDDAGAAWTYTLGGARFTGALNPPKPLPSGLFGASCAIGAVHAPAPTRPDEPTDAIGLAIAGHRFVEEESVEPSRGAAIFVVPRAIEGVALAPPHAAPP
ncbi:MAG: FG-GAP repeat protein [Planctomycetota bacterium]|nr:FG-GAP repeat protein [Planctomycetota bacterium]